QQIDLELRRQDACALGKKRKRRVARRRVAERRCHAGMEVAVLLREVGPVRKTKVHLSRGQVHDLNAQRGHEGLPGEACAYTRRVVGIAWLVPAHTVMLRSFPSA